MVSERGYWQNRESNRPFRRWLNKERVISEHTEEYYEARMEEALRKIRRKYLPRLPKNP